MAAARTSTGGVQRAQPRPVEPLAASGPVGEVLATALRDTAKQPAVPIGLLALVLAFLAFQNRIDRKDPKFAVAVPDDDATSPFGPPVS
ncbi:MAG TPA: hypothetical protein VNA30_06170 [Mycobacteriales bacterium]|nr:hypothetical protein [Mycobacteriales bacterium]